jgi:hypothetical protein
VGFIVSTPQQDKHIVSPDGCEFVSKADNRIKLYFPVGSVSQDENVEIKVSHTDAFCFYPITICIGILYPSLLVHMFSS